ncbi:Uncharacterized protein FKW44_009141, partial [Caligus rogercresseyi]
KAWTIACKRGDSTFQPASSFMCSLHFTEEDYERDLMHELLNLPIRKKIKKGVVPTLI